MLTRALSRLPKAQIVGARRALSLDFQPVDLTVDPLDESARSALAKSCYVRIEWKIHRKQTVYEAIKIMSANNIGALGITDDKGVVVGVVSERDYLNKVGLMGRTSKDTLVESIGTMGVGNLKSVTLDNPIDKCMNKMIASNVRHLFVRENGAKHHEAVKFIGMISVKDVVKCAIEKHNAVVNQLTGFIVNSEQMRRDV